MDRWLASLSKKMVATGAIAIGIILLLLIDPPHSRCDSQKEIFISDQTDFIFMDKTKKGIKTTGARRLIDACKVSNSPGGCYELFAQLRVLRKNLRRIALQCSKSMANISQVKSTVWEATELFVNLAWGASPPRSSADKFRWLDPADISLYCGLRGIIEDNYGTEAWSSFRERVMNELPGRENLSRDQLWARTLLSTNCVQFQ